ncbi:MAG TPA: cytochrome b/b6 domain-containing protein [Thermodesulfobacteriota bacterium]|nr:cytochrome b/b6 domain-containing protein [Thermodesulfobacteriota bacterium]
MKKIFVYDLPTRFFHWLFAFLFVAAFAIAKTVDDESPLFSYHMLAGIAIAFLLVLRFIWGFIGTTYARFSSFKLNPIELIVYFKDAVVSRTKSYLGHNPASSYAAVIMFACAIGLAVSGILMANGGENDTLEELHELLANIFLISVIIHVAGIVFHHLKKRDSLWSSMLDGKKKTGSGAPGIAGTRPVAGLLLVVLFVSWLGYLAANYDSSTRTLNILGTELRLGEAEHGAEGGYGEHGEEHDDD